MPSASSNTVAGHVRQLLFNTVGGAGSGGFEGHLVSLDVGNSFVYEFNKHLRFQELIEESGRTAECYFTGDGGLTLVDHSVRALTLDAIAFREYSFVFLQPRTFELTTSHPDADREAGIAAAVSLAGNVWDTSPNAVVVLVIPPAVGPADDLTDGDPFASSEEMHAETLEGCQLALDAIRAAYPTKTARLDTWGTGIWAIGGFYPQSNPDHHDSHRGDDYHPNDDSITIDIASRFSWIFREDPTPYAAAWIANQAAPIGGAFPLAPTDAEGLATYAYYFGRYGLYPPTFETHPTGVTVDDGDPFTLGPVSVRANPEATLAWIFNGAAIIPEATGTSYTDASAAPEDAGDYKVRATNDRGEHDSAIAEVEVSPDFQAFSIDFAYFPFASGLEAYTVLDMPTAVGSDVDGIEYPITDRTTAATPYTVELVAPSSAGANSNGTNGLLGTPGNVSGTYWGGNNVSWTFKIRNLPQVPIEFGIIGTRNSGDVRTTQITATGAGAPVVMSYNAGITPATVPTITVTPDGTGMVTFLVENILPSANNFNYVSWLTADLA